MTKKQMQELLAQLNNMLVPIDIAISQDGSDWSLDDILEAMADAEEALNRMKQAIYEAQQSLRETA